MQAPEIVDVPYRLGLGRFQFRLKPAGTASIALEEHVGDLLAELPDASPGLLQRGALGDTHHSIERSPCQLPDLLFLCERTLQILSNRLNRLWSVLVLLLLSLRYLLAFSLLRLLTRLRGDDCGFGRGRGFDLLGWLAIG